MTQLPDFTEFYLAHPERFDPQEWNTVPGEPVTRLLDAPAPAPAPPPDQVSLAQWQTPGKDQHDRGTCRAFAAVAGMEAAYLREHGINVSLSAHYAFHMSMSNELVSDYLTTTRRYENNSSFWGFRGNSEIVRFLATVAIPDEAACPYLTQVQLAQIVTAIGTVNELTTEDVAPPSQAQVDRFEYDERVLPQGAARAARYRVASFYGLPENPEPGAIESVLASGHEVVADVPGHCLLVVGYDRPNREWIVKNSQNPSSLERMAYDLPGSAPPRPFILGGYVITSVHPPTAQPQPSAWWLGRWAIDGPQLAGELVIRRTANYHGVYPPTSPTKVGSYYVAAGAEHDVTGQLEGDGSVLRIWIATNPGKVPPGTTEGRELVFVQWSSAPDEAVEHQPPEGVWPPARLRRLPLPQTFDLAMEVHVLAETDAIGGVASYPVLSCGPQTFPVSSAQYDEEFVITATGLAPGVALTWSVGGVALAPGPQRVDVSTDPASPAGLGRDGLVEHAPGVVSVEATASADKLTLHPSSVACWLQVTASAPGYDLRGVPVIVRGTVHTVAGLDLAEAACLGTVGPDIVKSEEHVPVVILDDPEYAGLDPRDAAALARLDAGQRQKVMGRRRLVAALADSAPEQARALAEATELVYRLRRGFLSG